MNYFWERGWRGQEGDVSDQRPLLLNLVFEGKGVSSPLNAETALNFLVPAFHPHLALILSSTTCHLSDSTSHPDCPTLNLVLSVCRTPVSPIPFLSSSAPFFTCPCSPASFPFLLPLLSATLPPCPRLLPSASLCDPIALSSPHHSSNSTTLVRCTVEKARSSESLHCPTSRLGPRIFWWLQMWQVVVSTSKMYLWSSTMTWPRTLRVSAGERASLKVKGDSLPASSRISPPRGLLLSALSASSLGLLVPVRRAPVLHLTWVCCLSTWDSTLVFWV